MGPFFYVVNKAASSLWNKFTFWVLDDSFKAKLSYVDLPSKMSIVVSHGNFKNAIKISSCHRGRSWSRERERERERECVCVR